MFDFSLRGVHRDGEGMVGQCEASAHILQSGAGERWALALDWLSPFMPSRTPAYGMVPPTVASLLTSTYVTPHKHTQDACPLMQSCPINVIIKLTTTGLDSALK